MSTVTILLGMWGLLAVLATVLRRLAAGANSDGAEERCRRDIKALQRSRRSRAGVDAADVWSAGADADPSQSRARKAVAFGTIGLFAALRFGSGEAVQGLFPVFFVFLFLSAMALPLDLLTTDWFHTIASVNPVTYLLEAFRSLLIEGWNIGQLALGFAIAAAIFTLGMLAATRALKTRLVRT